MEVFSQGILVCNSQLKHRLFLSLCIGAFFSNISQIFDEEESKSELKKQHRKEINLDDPSYVSPLSNCSTNIVNCQFIVWKLLLRQTFIF